MGGSLAGATGSSAETVSSLCVVLLDGALSSSDTEACSHLQALQVVCLACRNRECRLVRMVRLGRQKGGRGSPQALRKELEGRRQSPDLAEAGCHSLSKAALLQVCGSRGGVGSCPDGHEPRPPSAPTPLLPWTDTPQGAMRRHPSSHREHPEHHLKEQARH